MAKMRTFGGRNYFSYGVLFPTKREAHKQVRYHRDHAWVRVVKDKGGWRLYLSTK